MFVLCLIVFGALFLGLVITALTDEGGPLAVGIVVAVISGTIWGVVTIVNFGMS